MLNAYYDLQVSPASYDFVSFLLAAEKHRIEIKESTMNIHIIPGDCYGFRRDESYPRSIGARSLLLKNVVVPMPQLLPSVVGTVTYPYTRREDIKLCEGNVFPVGYTLRNPISCYGQRVMVEAWRAGHYPLTAPIGKKKMPSTITITMREAQYYKERNSNRATWLRAAAKILELNHEVVFIPDVDTSEPLSYPVNTTAAFSVLARGALYAAATHNLFVNTGAAWLAAAMWGVPCTVFKMVTPSCKAARAEYFTQQGFSVGSQIGRPNHTIIWEDDTVEAVLPVIEKICKGVW